MTDLESFVRAHITRTSDSNASHPADVRERERQEAIIARAANIATWRNYVATKEPAETVSGETVRTLREAVGLDTAALAEVLGVHRQAVEALEASGDQGSLVILAEDGVRRFVSAARDVILSSEVA